MRIMISRIVILAALGTSVLNLAAHWLSDASLSAPLTLLALAVLASGCYETALYMSRPQKQGAAHD